MLHLRLLASQAGSYKLCNILIHPLLPEGFLEVLVHLSHARMQTKTNLISFLKNQSSLLCITRHTDSTSESQHAIITQGKLIGLFRSKQSQEVSGYS